MLKLVVVDLDKTLLKNDKTISTYTKDIFLKLRDRGIKVVINTARRYEISEPFLKEINGFGVICYNGAMVYSDGKQIAKHVIANSKVRNFLAKICNLWPERKWSVAYLNNTYTNYDDPYYIQVNSLADLPDENPLMVLVRNVMEEEYPKFYRTIGDDGLYVRYLEKCNIIVTNENARKDRAMKYIMQYYNISSDEVIAFGDDINDIAFMSEAGISVAVKNATDEVKEIADYICPSNDCDGVATWLAQYCDIEGELS